MRDLVREYTQEEDEALARNLEAISSEIHRGVHRARPPTILLLCDFHAALFRGVRSHAGKHRDRNFGSERLTFGPNRSVHRSKVREELESIFDAVRRSIASFDRNPDQETYDQDAFHLALWAHAEVVRVHPFEDGNGRSSRTLMNWLLVRLGLRPIAIEVPKVEYHDCLNHYYKERDLVPLLDLALSLYQVS